MRSLSILLALSVAACSGTEIAPVSASPPAAPLPPAAPASAPPPAPSPQPASPPVPAPVPAVGLGVGDTGGGSTPCHADYDCVLVTGGCSSAIGAHRDDAAAVDASHQALLSIAECSGGPTVPTRVYCDGLRCLAQPLDHPEWRGCARDRDCTAAWRGCQRWEAVARSSAEAAHAAWTGEECPSIVPQMPDARCAYEMCALDWAGSR